VQLAVVAAHERRREPVRVLVQRLQAMRLRAQEAAAEDVVLVAADGDDVAARGFDGEPAGRLAERTGAEVRLGFSRDRQSLTGLHLDRV
jgi:hypothetical protein